jgi:hypothetical protein
VILMSRPHIRGARAAFQAHLSGIALLRLHVRKGHTDLDESAAAWFLDKPPSNPPWSPSVRLYLHALCIEDITIQSVLRDGAPLFASLWPNEGGPNDAAALRQYASAVHASTDAYLEGLPSDGLRRVVDLRKLGLGRHTVMWISRRFVVQELGHICGEIAGCTAASATASISQTRPAALPVLAHAD